MSARREVTLTCNQCFDSFTVQNTASIRFGRKQAAYMGWVRYGKLDFCSPAHMEDYRRRQAIYLTVPLHAMRGVQVIRTGGLAKGYVPPSASLRGQDILDRTPVPPKPEGRTVPVIVEDAND